MHHSQLRDISRPVLLTTSESGSPPESSRRGFVRDWQDKRYFGLGGRTRQFKTLVDGAGTFLA